jgi:uncharacterized membrane protein YdjX (TVP38/TMEM64 family)
MDNKKWLRVSGFSVLCISIFVMLYVNGYFQYFTFEEFAIHRMFLLQYVQEYPMKSKLIFMAVYVLEAMLFIPIGALLSMVGGFLFGFVPAICMINIATTFVASIMFIIVRYYLRKSFQVKYEDKIFMFNKEIVKRGVWYLLVVRLIPIIPFFLVNIGAGLMPVSLFTFIWTTSIGTIPLTAAYVYVGSKLTIVNGTEGLFSHDMIVIYLVLTMLVLAPIFANWLRQRSIEQNNAL